MPKSSIADAILGWEKALANIKTSAPDAPGIAGYTAPLEEILAQAKALSASLEARKAVKQQESKDRKLVMQQGNVQISRIRSALKAFFGPSSEMIIEYGGRPVRPRKKKKPVPPSAPVPPAATTPTPPPAHGGPAAVDAKPEATSPAAVHPAGQ